ncbi:VOC family protein [Amycolatopsis rubida]|uniref:VOC family protein n=1 Tax=Amycolatopsis rubida TaxID=112413 RepID=A0ABX0BYS6_9PSEU|nr:MULTISPECIES: VOC family protein [Amycolatopsis]MYW93964.1 VOC family protein [Amycolatopsis rubida]NEC58953.1 VOC family protein [Amycolatopsis rubida]OAP20948.1 Glyoxalase-like domain protein [Amycolatopsis sp. M39]
MLTESKAFSGIAVDDLDAARNFYSEVLGLDVRVVDEKYGLLGLAVAGDREVLVYQHPRHRPGNYTVLNFPVPDIEAVVDRLAGRGVEFLRYDDFDADERGIYRGGGPLIAWFADPAGNILSVLQDQD